MLAILLFALRLAPGVDLVPGQFVRGEQPDGNSVVFHGSKGLVIVDTGRHPEHTRKLLELGEPKAIINTHWHLDHTGGNVLLRERYPGLRVYASDAIASARKGFLARYREQMVKADAEKYRAEIALIDAGDKLAPDEIIAESGERTLAGRKFLIGLERRAATDGDVWVLDLKTRTLAAGDLVTLPVPFLDTACASGWQAALDHLAKQDFRTLVPGHGEPMTRADLDTYRKAFGELVACAASARNDCGTAWFAAIGKLAGGTDPALARDAMDYYLKSGKLTATCAE